MGNYGVILVLLGLSQFVYTQSTNDHSIDPVFFQDGNKINSFSKRQIWISDYRAYRDYLDYLDSLFQDPRNPLTNNNQRQQQSSIAPMSTPLKPFSPPPNQSELHRVQNQKYNDNYNAQSQRVQTQINNENYNYNAITDFAWSIFRESKLTNSIGNLILCPILVQLLLSQLETVAIANTKREISTVIRNVDPHILSRLITNIKSTKYRNELTLASAVFNSKDIALNQSFVAESRSRDIGVQPVNFGKTDEALYTINNWISVATKDQIRDLFKPEHLQGLRVLLTNTMYFRGLWRTTFNGTINDQFYSTDKLHKGISFMTKKEKLRGSEFVSGNGAKGTWVELPYEGNEFSMVVILPEVRHTLENLIRQFTTTDLIEIIGQLEEPHKRLVYMKLPKFSIQSSFSLKNVLEKMGLADLFTMKSQLPYFTNNHEPITVSDMLQHTVLNVDENGTVATAATFATVIPLSLNTVPTELIFYADQPFLAIIVDKRAKVPLFIAKIFDP